jgi:hypothetical protein
MKRKRINKDDSLPLRWCFWRPAFNSATPCPISFSTTDRSSSALPDGLEINSLIPPLYQSEPSGKVRPSVVGLRRMRHCNQGRSDKRSDAESGHQMPRAIYF